MYTLVLPTLSRAVCVGLRAWQGPLLPVRELLSQGGGHVVPGQGVVEPLTPSLQQRPSSPTSRWPHPPTGHHVHTTTSSAREHSRHLTAHQQKVANSQFRIPLFALTKPTHPYSVWLALSTHYNALQPVNQLASRTARQAGGQTGGGRELQQQGVSWNATTRLNSAREQSRPHASGRNYSSLGGWACRVSQAGSFEAEHQAAKTEPLSHSQYV